MANIVDVLFQSKFKTQRIVAIQCFLEHFGMLRELTHILVDTGNLL